MNDCHSTRLVSNDAPNSDFRASPRHWQLFVDESGQFNEDKSHVHCAGLLLARALSGPLHDAIKSELVRLAPEFTWPLHAAFLRVPAVYALAPYANGNVAAYRVGANVLPAAAVVARLLAKQSADTQVVLDSLMKGKEPQMPILWRLDDTLREVLPETHHALGNRAAEISSGIRRLLRALCRSAPGIFGAAALLLSVEEWVGAAADASAAPLAKGSARYDRLLRALFIHVDRTLSSSRDEQHIQAQVLTRRRSDPASRQPVYVDRRHVESLVGEAIPLVRNVRVAIEGVYAFDRHVNGGLVLADFVSHWAFDVLRNCPAYSLARVTELLQIKTGLPVSSGTPPRSHIGCAKSVTLPPRSQAREWALEARAQWEA